MTPSGLRFWLHPVRWLRALVFWWVPALLCLLIGVAAAGRLLRDRVALSWRGMDAAEHPDARDRPDRD